MTKGLTTHIKDPFYSAYRVYARNLISMIIAATLANKAISGHWMHQNDAGNTFNLELGQTPEGKKRCASGLK